MHTHTQTFTTYICNQYIHIPIIVGFILHTTFLGHTYLDNPQNQCGFNQSAVPFLEFAVIFEGFQQPVSGEEFS